MDEVGKKMGGSDNMCICAIGEDMNSGFVSFGDGNFSVNEIRSARVVIDELATNWR